MDHDATNVAVEETQVAQKWDGLRKGYYIFRAGMDVVVGRDGEPFRFSTAATALGVAEQLGCPCAVLRVTSPGFHLG